MRGISTVSGLAASAAALALVAGAFAPAAVAAVAQPTAQENLDYWWSAYGIDQAHSEGLTGQGVKVAVVEKQINPDLPVFQGRNLHVSGTPICVNNPEVTTSDVNDASIHGTTIAAYLIGNGNGGGSVRGIAPDADLTFYGYGPDNSSACETADGNKLSGFAAGVMMAVDGGAKVIYTAIGGSFRQDDVPAIAYALAKGAVIVSASINPGQLGAREGDLGSYNGVISTAAIDRDGNLQQLDGAPFTIPQTTVVAAGEVLPAVGSDDSWDRAGAGTGSSFASPIVAGMLTLAAQKSPSATGSQLIQALISTTNGTQHAPTRTEDGYGYGAAWLPTLLTVDPASLPDANPLMDKSSGYPTADQVAEAQANGYSPAERPRSIDQLEEQNGSTADALPIIVWVVIGVVVLLAVAVVIGITITVFIISRRRKARKEQAA